MMAPGPGKVLYYTEQKSKIGTIELSVKPDLVTPFYVSISEERLQVAGREIELMEETRIKHQDIGAPLLDNSIINIRIPTERVLKVPSPRKQTELELDKVYCVRCSSFISHKKFSRTLPLPSAAWHEVTDTLLCHGSHQKMVNGCYPRPGDCLVGEQEYWVAWDVVVPSRVYISSVREVERAGSAQVTASLHCHRCRNKLGRAVYGGDRVEWAVIWKHSVKTGLREAPYHVESYIAHSLLDASTRHVSYRFIVLPRGATSPFPGVRGATSPFPGVRGATSPFPGVRLWMMGGALSISSSLAPLIDQAVRQIGGTVSLSHQAMKVLYTKHSEGTMAGIWSDADVISLPLDLCIHLWFILQLSSITMPPCKRYAQNCRVGYIRYS